MAARDMWKGFLRNMNRGLTANPSITLFIIISLVIHLLDVFSDFRNTSFRIFAYLILTFAAWLTLFNDQENTGVANVANIKVPIILSSIAIFAPYLGGIIPFLGGSQAFQTAIIFFPAWVLYLCFAMGQNWFITICRWGIVLLVVFLVFPALINGFINDLRVGDIETGINVQQTISNTMRDLSYGFNSVIKNIGKTWKNVYNSLIQTATGDYYTGRVDDYEHEPVGVYLEGLEASDSKFFEGEKIIVWATLKAKTLGDKEININVSCYAKEGDKKINGNITPQNEFNIATEEEETLDCVFDKLNPGKKEVIFNAEFNFETMAYLKTYFMDKERLRAFKREEIDVFQHYGISHINPIAIYTNGPIGIGMKTAEPLPIGVYSDQENNPFFFGITIENNWEGIIKKVTNLEIQVHDSLELTNCDHEFEFKEKNDDGYNVYSLVPDKRTENISNYYSIKCRLNPADPKSLLGNEPITTRYFRVTVNYIYELEKSTPVEIEEVKEYISPGEAMTEENKIEELKSQSEIKEICENILKCGDYDGNYYDKLGFCNQEWCDTNPCNLDCYSAFEKSGDEVSYDLCKECPHYITIQDLPSEDYCKIYFAEDYCEKDICNFGDYNIECQWYDDKCMMGFLKKEEWKDYDDSEVELKIRGAAKEYGYPEKLILGIAETENEGLKHIDGEGNVVENKETGCIGVMQIQTKNNWCSLCSKTKEELKDINTNIECGVRIFKNKYNTFCDSEGNIKKKNDGTTIFESSVRKNCFNDEYINKYLKYDGNCVKMAIRGYNGLGCDKNADTSYVENVMGHIEKFA